MRELTAMLDACAEYRAKLDELERENAALREDLDECALLLEENAALRAALEALCDEQNGPPLERRSTEWNAAYERARAALARKEAQP